MSMFPHTLPGSVSGGLEGCWGCLPILLFPLLFIIVAIACNVNAM